MKIIFTVNKAKVATDRNYRIYKSEYLAGCIKTFCICYPECDFLLMDIHKGPVLTKVILKPVTRATMESDECKLYRWGLKSSNTTLGFLDTNVFKATDIGYGINVAYSLLHESI